MARGEVTRQDDEGLFLEVLGRATRAVESQGIPSVVFGSIASAEYGRPGATGDIDILVRPPDADRALQSLDDAGFDTEATDPAWIYKAFRDGVLVDVIFQVRGDMHLDEDMLAHARTVSCQGQPIQLMSPEDAVVVEAVSHDVQSPGHWHNALGILAASDLDWAYLERRARFGVRRMISLLTYAHSNDLIVPEWVIRSLLENAYGPAGAPAPLPREPGRRRVSGRSPRSPSLLSL